MLGLHMGKLPQTKFDTVTDTEDWLQAINRASVIANTESGLLDRALARKIRDALNALEKEAHEPGYRRCALYIEFEPKLLGLCGIHASVLHAGRSSQDILATANAGMNRERIVKLAEELLTLLHALTGLARREQDSIVPAYTNGVQAQPTYFSHYLLAHYQVFSRDLARLRECFERYDACPMGSAVCNGTGWPLNTERMAALLGFSRSAGNAFDAGQCQGNDLPLEISQIIAGIMLHVNQFLSDFMVQYAQTRPWIIYDSTNGVYHSSAMPQKRNPGYINDCRRDAGLVLGETQGVMLRMQNLSLGMPDVRDADTMAELARDCACVISTFADIISHLKVNQARALEELNSDWTCTQEIADTLMLKAGIDFRTGHAFASGLVSRARALGKTPANTTYAEVAECWREWALSHNCPETLPLSEDELSSAMDPKGILAERKTAGSASGSEILRQLERAESALEQQALWIGEKYATMQAAHELREKLLNEL